MYGKDDSIVYTPADPFIAYLNSKETRGYLFAPFPEFSTLLGQVFTGSLRHKANHYAKYLACALCLVYQSLDQPETWRDLCRNVSREYQKKFKQFKERTEAIHRSMYRRAEGLAGRAVSYPEMYFPVDRMQYQEDSRYVVALQSEWMRFTKLAGSGSPPSEKDIRGSGPLTPELRRELAVLMAVLAE